MPSENGPVRVKVCGITNVNDGVRAASLGASALGFIFWPHSPRYVSPDRAASVVEATGPMTSAVGVFVDEEVVRIHETVAAAKLDVVQLHGDEPYEMLRTLRVRTIRAVALGPLAPEVPIDLIPPNVTVLLDAHDPIGRGGSGQQVDWTEAARWARGRRVILSGGLRPDNVTAAIEKVRPYGVDVSSGVEAEPGRKDARKLEAFFDAVAAAQV